MILYHISQSLQCGDALIADFQRLEDLCEPFAQALERSGDCFYAMLLSGKYLYAVLCKFHLREWSDYAKWATEGLFEFVRKNEYPHCYSRVKCFFFYDNFQDSERLYWDDWGGATEEERAAVHLFEVELADDAPERRDMSLFDKAYDAISQQQDTEAALHYARQYFAGEHSDAPIWELLSDKKAVAIQDVTDRLTQGEHLAEEHM